MRRKLFNLAALLSLILCVAAGVFWAGSYRARMAGPLVDFAGARGGTFGAIRLFARPERSAYITSLPGRVLFIQQSSTGPLDASHCGVFGLPGLVTVYSPPDVVQGTVTPASAKVVIKDGAGTQVGELAGGPFQIRLPAGRFTAQCQPPSQKTVQIFSLSQPTTVNIDCS